MKKLIAIVLLLTFCAFGHPELVEGQTVICESPHAAPVDSLTTKFYVCQNSAGHLVGQDSMLAWINRHVTGTGGGVSTISVATANGFAGTVANPTSTPVVTVKTTITGMLKGNGTAISAATPGTDYTTPSSTESFTNKSGNISQWTNDEGYLTSLSGAVLTAGSYTNPSWLVSLPWSKITGTPTTLSGYGVDTTINHSFAYLKGQFYPLSSNPAGYLTSSTGWKLTGNAGTSTPTDFIGTTDNKGFNTAEHGVIYSHKDSLGRELIPQTIIGNVNFTTFVGLTVSNNSSMAGGTSEIRVSDSTGGTETRTCYIQGNGISSDVNMNMTSTGSVTLNANTTSTNNAFTVNDSIYTSNVHLSGSGTGVVGLSSTGAMYRTTGGGGSGTVTSVAASGGTGISVSGSPITGAGTFTITNTSPLSALSLTTTGTSGAATLSGTTLNIPQYTGTVYSAGTGINISGNTISNSSPFSAVSGTSPINISGNTISFSSTYSGNTSLSTLGTITTGTWHGTAIGNSYLANSTISGVSLGSNLYALTLGYGLTGTSYNGSTTVTAAVDTAHSAGWGKPISQMYSRSIGDSLFNSIKYGDDVFIASDNYSSITQGSWAYASPGSTQYKYQYTWGNVSSSAQNDQINYGKVTLPAGTYTFRIFGIANNNRAKYHILVDGTDVGSIDFYMSSNTINYTGTLTNVSIATGQHTIGIKATDKNSSSSGYYMIFDELNIQRQ